MEPLPPGFVEIFFAMLLVLVSFHIPIGGYSPFYGIGFPFSHKTIEISRYRSEFRNNDFRDWQYPRLSYRNTLSITNFSFPKLHRGMAQIIYANIKESTIIYNESQLIEKYSLSLSLVEVADVYVSPGNFFFNGGVTYFDDCACMIYAKSGCPDHFTEVTGYYDLIIGFQHAHTQYGHFVFDHFANLLLLPQAILKEATFLYNGRFSFMKLYFDVIGVPMSHVLNTRGDQIFHADRYFYFTPTPCHAMNSYLDQALRGIMRRAFSIPEDGAIKPWRCIIYERETDRKISNLLEHLECFQSLASKNMVFEIVGDMLSFNETSHFFYEVHIFFSVHGSIFPNIIFMQKGSIYAEHHLQALYYLGISLAYSLGINTVFSFDPSLERWIKEVQPKVDLSAEIINASINMFRYHKQL